MNEKFVKFAALFLEDLSSLTFKSIQKDKDREKRQPVSEPITTDEPQLSSTKLTLHN